MVVGLNSANLAVSMNNISRQCSYNNKPSNQQDISILLVPTLFSQLYEFYIMLAKLLKFSVCEGF